MGLEIMLGKSELCKFPGGLIEEGIMHELLRFDIMHVSFCWPQYKKWLHFTQDHVHSTLEDIGCRERCSQLFGMAIFHQDCPRERHAQCLMTPPGGISFSVFTELVWGKSMASLVRHNQRSCSDTCTLQRWEIVFMRLQDYTDHEWWLSSWLRLGLTAWNRPPRSPDLNLIEYV